MEMRERVKIHYLDWESSVKKNMIKIKSLNDVNNRVIFIEILSKILSLKEHDIYYQFASEEKIGNCGEKTAGAVIKLLKIIH